MCYGSDRRAKAAGDFRIRASAKDTVFRLIPAAKVRIARRPRIIVIEHLAGRDARAPDRGRPARFRSTQAQDASFTRPAPLPKHVSTFIAQPDAKAACEFG